MGAFSQETERSDGKLPSHARGFWTAAGETRDARPKAPRLHAAYAAFDAASFPERTEAATGSNPVTVQL